MSTLHVILICFCTSLLTAASTPVLVSLGHRHLLLDFPGAHKKHPTPVPALGGVSLFFSLWLSVLGLLWFGIISVPLSTTELLWILGGAILITGAGLYDDIKGLSAWGKLAAQSLAAACLIAGGFNAQLLAVPLFGEFPLDGFGWLVTLLWVIVLTNAINFIDGLDGLATGVSLIAAITMILISTLYHSAPSAMLAASLTGFLFTFLWFNRSPAKIFLGDSGSLQIGYYFAVISLLFPLKSFTAAALYLPLLALGVPLLEAFSSVTRRSLKGVNPMKADRSHLFHLLSARGLSNRKVLALFYGLAVIFSGFSLSMYMYDRRLVVTLLAFFMVVILACFHIFTKHVTHDASEKGYLTQDRVQKKGDPAERAE